MALPSPGSMKSWTLTGSGWPLGCHSRPPLWKSPTSSFFLVSTEMTGSPGVLNTLCEVSCLSGNAGPVGSAERTPTMTTTDSEMMEDPVRPVIDDELVDRLMAQVDAQGLELLGPEGVLTELTSRILSRGLGGGDG